MTRARPLVAALGLLIWLAGTAPASARPDCRTILHDEVNYSICTVQADRDDVRLWHSDASGKLLGSFSAINELLSGEQRQLAFAMNGGMYHDDRRPVGLYLENGRQTAPLVTREGPGNFGLLPNGVFCIMAGRAAVIESRAFAAAPPPCRFASQSGPMLVIDGALHPRFLVDSSSRFVRNGVGVGADGRTVHFAISNGRVTFHEFGRLFRDVLKTPNALYFDGKVSRLYAPQIGRDDVGFALGPIVGVAVPR